MDGNVRSDEVAQYVNNFLNVYRVRPRDADDDVPRSEDDVSDEELEVSHNQLHEMLKTRVGGRYRGKNSLHDADETEEQVSHRENSSSGIILAESLWGADANKKR